MDNDVVVFAQFMTVVAGFTAAMVGLWAVVRFVRHLTRPKSPSLPAAGMDDARFARLEQAVDAIAIEVERIAEGQRFTTKLLAERASVAAERTTPE